MTIEITTAHGSVDEERTADFLQQLIEKYDVGRWQFTDHVVLDEDAIPHSHPVLTLSTRVRDRSLTGLLATYLHEQLHWYVREEDDAEAIAAIDEMRALFPSVPDETAGGAHDEFSTYLHLIVNWLEIESLRQVIGREEADAFFQREIDGPVYPWIYRQCIERSDEIAAVVRRHGLDAILNAP